MTMKASTVKVPVAWWYYWQLEFTYEYNYVYELTLWLGQSPQHRTWPHLLSVYPSASATSSYLHQVDTPLWDINSLHLERNNKVLQCNCCQLLQVSSSQLWHVQPIEKLYKYPISIRKHIYSNNVIISIPGLFEASLIS